MCPHDAYFSSLSASVRWCGPSAEGETRTREGEGTDLPSAVTTRSHPPLAADLDVKPHTPQPRHNNKHLVVHLLLLYFVVGSPRRCRGWWKRTKEEGDATMWANVERLSCSLDTTLDVIRKTCTGRVTCICYSTTWFDLRRCGTKRGCSSALPACSLSLQQLFADVSLSLSQFTRYH